MKFQRQPGSDEPFQHQIECFITVANMIADEPEKVVFHGTASAPQTPRCLERA